jgi:hypothetical protein
VKWEFRECVGLWDVRPCSRMRQLGIVDIMVAAGGIYLHV